MLDHCKSFFIKLGFISIFLFLFTTNYSLAKEENEALLKGNISTDIAEQYPVTNIGVVGLRYVHQIGFSSLIEEVYENSPSSRAGIQRGDLIYAIDGLRTDKLSSDGVFELISGSPGTKVKMLLIRGRTKLELELTREDIARFPENIQARYLAGPIQIPFNGSDFGGYFY